MNRASALEVPSTPAPAFAGEYEYRSEGMLLGWLVNLAAPEHLTSVEFLLNGHVVGDAACSLTESWGVELSQNSAPIFYWLVPLHLRNLAEHITVRIQGTEVYLKPRTPAIEKLYVDSFDASGISGWFEPSDEDTGRITLLINQLIAAEVDAKIQRADVIHSGISTKALGFFIPFPDDLIGSTLTSAKVILEGSGRSADVPLTVSRIELSNAGGFDVDRGVVKGWISRRLVAEHTYIIAYSGEQHIQTVALTPSQDEDIFEFAFELPLCIERDVQQRVQLSLRDTHLRLAYRGSSPSYVAATNLVGRVDLINRHEIAGWVYDKSNPDTGLIVDIFDNEQLIGSVPTDIVRADVNKHFGMAGAHGFRFYFPLASYDTKKHKFIARARGITLHYKLHHLEPISLAPHDLAHISAADRYRGAIDNLTCEYVSGWAVDTKSPNTPVHVALRIDGELFGVFPANRFAARLRNSAFSGHHGFSFPIPARAMNGRMRQVSVTILESQMELKAPKSHVLFPLVDYFGTQHVQRRGNYIADLKSLPIAPNLPYIVEPAVPVDALVSIVVLNRDGAEILAQMLESFECVQWRNQYEILLVDHGSTDTSLDVARQFENRLPLRVFDRGYNYSFAQSNNFAAKQAKGDFIVFANNDLVMLHDCFAVMLKNFGDPTIGLVGTKLFEPVAATDGGWSFVCHHNGIDFKNERFADPGRSSAYYTGRELHSERMTPVTVEHAAATAALLMCRKEEFLEVGGFCEDYIYGMEDVDLCLLFREKLNKRTVVDPCAVAVHNRSATRELKLVTPEENKVKSYNAQQHMVNRRRFIERFARRLPHQILASLIGGEKIWRSTPLRVTIVVTEAAISTSAGDFFTAVEFAESLKHLFGWEVMFATMGTFSMPGTDVVVVMRHDYQLGKVTDLNPGCITVAWVRNRVDEWLASPSFGAYQLVFASSNKAIDVIQNSTGVPCVLLPIASNHRRFAPAAAEAEHVADVTFTGNYWGAEREAIGLQQMGARYEFAIYGHGWNTQAAWRPHWRGAVPYVEMPRIYGSTKIVLDDSHPVTREWGSLNSRVFDALACGKLVLTNCAEGARDLFADKLPSFSTAEEMQALLERFLSDDQARESLAAELREEVLLHHTYDARALQFKTELARFASSSLRIAIKIGVPNHDEKDNWGDYHFAKSLGAAFVKAGHFARVDILPEWYSGLSATDDVVIVLRGLSQYKPSPTALNLMWLISHPDNIAPEELQGYDHVFCASEPYTRWLSARIPNASTLLQCTDPSVFYRDVEKSLHVPDVIFVGNSRGQAREVVRYAVQERIDVAVYGSRWEGLLPPHFVKQTYIPNGELRKYYSTSKIVLNDHWADMRRHGFASNRIFDAGICGAAIITDEVESARELFGDALTYYHDAEDLKVQVDTLLKDSKLRTRRGNKLKKLIAERHTFDNRVADILQTVRSLQGKVARGER